MIFIFRKLILTPKSVAFDRIYFYKLSYCLIKDIRITFELNLI